MKKVAIAYRIYPKVSKVPPVYAYDKLKLSEFALASFARALVGVDYKLWALLDDCPIEYKELFKRYIPAERLELINLPGIGNAGTFSMQSDILLKQEFSDNIYFAEDDYFYLPEAMKKMLGFCEQQGKCFITPYDHLDNYTLDLHKYKSKVSKSKSHHWRTTASTCMTFLANKQAFAEVRPAFETYSKKNYDSSIWMSITKINAFNLGLALKYAFKNLPFFKIYVKLWMFGGFRLLTKPKYDLWSPLPSLSTHLDSDYLAPTIDWRHEFSKFVK